ncbi:hypothetical protein, partial [Butyricimonas virosa]|uniref:hypothetical protein n=1 Tax=Butyricimonas virosa TaxID=544645 RepID=UPI001C70A958
GDYFEWIFQHDYEKVRKVWKDPVITKTLSHSLRGGCALVVASSKQIMAVFSVTSWLPQKRKFFLRDRKWA